MVERKRHINVSSSRANESALITVKLVSREGFYPPAKQMQFVAYGQEGADVFKLFVSVFRTSDSHMLQDSSYHTHLRYVVAKALCYKP
jgi:hypothetical protein